MHYYTDGGSYKKIGIILVTDIDGNILLKKTFQNELTNNELEYEAIIAGMELAQNNDVIYNDSKLCVEQINGDFKIRQKKLIPYSAKAKKIQKEKNLIIIWIPRDQNPSGKSLERIKRKYKNTQYESY